ncbi:MAG TPA: polysaccharide deacetylase family protein [Chthoniobacterales bacterium]|nr:polysaccharide deacetylase family protein [Chthoniobacterales bacterium]
MRARLFSLPCLYATLICSIAFAAKPTPAPKAAAAAATATAAPAISKPVIDQTAQTIIYCYHRLVDKVRYPGTEITPAAFEAQMKELKDRGITVISMQDLLAWKRGDKNIPPRCAVITFDDGWKSQYEVAWPLMKKFGYTFTMFIYTEGVAGGSLGGGQAITWEQLADMRDNGIDIEAHSATHQDLREGHTIMVAEPGGKRTKKKLSGAEYEQWVQNEVVGCKTLLEQRLGIKVNCFAVPFGNYNEHVKEIARNAGYEAMFTVYGQPITYTSPMDALGRYAIEANKPKVFEDAVKMIATSGGGPGAPAAAVVGAENLHTEPADGTTVRTALPLIKANLSPIGQIDPASVQLRISGLGLVPASFDPKTGIVSYQVTQKLRDKSCTVILSAKSGDKKVETHWTFGIDEATRPAVTAPTATPKK